MLRGAGVVSAERPLNRAQNRQIENLHLKGQMMGIFINSSDLANIKPLPSKATPMLSMRLLMYYLAAL